MKIQKKFLVFQINKFELVTGNSPYYDNTYHLKILDLTKGDIFQLSLSQDDGRKKKSVAVKISAVFWTPKDVDLRRVF